MKPHLRLLAVAVLLALAACRPGAAEYSDSEAPKDLILDNASSYVSLRFAPGSSRLVAGDAARLRTMAASGGIAASDRVFVAAAGSPALATARFQTISAELLRYGVVAHQRQLA